MIKILDVIFNLSVYSLPFTAIASFWSDNPVWFKLFCSAGIICLFCLFFAMLWTIKENMDNEY